ncbi:MAG: hypothetical protein JNL40_04195 [Cyclobacteriaceae bacterium]|nr:hypothetical protein [Cyclobacteriaceae bacterium]
MENSTMFESTSSLLGVGAVACLAAAIAILIFHEVRILLVRDPKDRYDYVNTHEIRYFWYAVIAIIASAGLYLNKVVGPMIPVPESMLPIVRIFFLAAFVVIAYLLLSNGVKLLYPPVIERRLNKIRNKPRVSPAGNVMRKLKEEEESVHLDQSQIDAQASTIHSVEYDVWVDEKTGFKRVEKYMGYQHAEKCGECGFFTMKIDSEEIVRKPSATEEGLLVKHYRCSYCKHRERRDAVIAKLSTNA